MKRRSITFVRLTIILPLTLVCFGCFAQSEDKHLTSDILSAPTDWGKESFDLPPPFVADFDIIGTEEVRFSPGWDDPSSAQFWTYTFAWYVDGDVGLTAPRLEALLVTYFSSLTQSVGRDKRIAKEKISSANAQFSATHSKGDQRIYRGYVKLFDAFFTQKQIRLNAEVRENYCPELNKHLIVLSFSPRKFGDVVWKTFDQVQSPKDCLALQQVTSTSFTTVETDDYELMLPKGKQTGVLLLFPGFPESPEVVKREFEIVAPAMRAGIALVLMKFNRRIWLEKDEKTSLSNVINRLVEEHRLPKESVYIGGFSSGGNVSLLISNYLVQSESEVQPQGVFIIDSPVDLLALYENSQRNIQRNFSPVAVQESTMIVSMMESAFGKPEDSLALYEKHAVYTGQTHNTSNLSHLKDVKLRFYTEPDTLWWKQNRQNDYEETNAHAIKNLADELTEKFGDHVTYISTQNRGYRANGDRHPHAWSIVEIDDLMHWITNK